MKLLIDENRENITIELLPTLEIGWLNGWILICLLYLTYSIVPVIFPKDVVERLYDKSGRTKRHNALVYLGSDLRLCILC